MANHHYVSREDFAADLADARGEPATEESIDLQYDGFLRDVEAVQLEQVTILRDLIAEHGIKAVYLEGVTEANVDAYRTRAQKLRSLDINRVEIRSMKSQNAEVVAKSREILEFYREELLRMGAVGRLLVNNELDDVLPLDDADLMDAADPANDAREAAMVRKLLAGGPVVVAVLGQAHDLRAEIAAACPTCRLEVVAPERLVKINGGGR